MSYTDHTLRKFSIFKREKPPTGAYLSMFRATLQERYNGGYELIGEINKDPCRINFESLTDLKSFITDLENIAHELESRD